MLISTGAGDRQMKEWFEMVRVEITWSYGSVPWGKESLKTSQMKSLDQEGFYAILDESSGQVLFIGHAFGQSLRDCIPEKHEGLEKASQKPNARIVVKVGLVTWYDGTLDEDLANDVECCLIRRNQPEFNTQCKDKYSGKPISIINLGDFTYLAPHSDC